jgi:hypothetical protein
MTDRELFLVVAFTIVLVPGVLAWIRQHLRDTKAVAQAEAARDYARSILDQFMSGTVEETIRLDVTVIDETFITRPGTS